MTNKDREALNKISWAGNYYVQCTGYEIRRDSDTVPVKRFRCRSGKCFHDKNNQNLFPVDKVFLGNHRKGIICRCHLCGAFQVFPLTAFEEPKKISFHFDDSAEARERRLMKMNGCDEEDINFKCEFMKDEFAKEDRKRKIADLNFRSSIKAQVEENERTKAAADFKSRLEKGEIQFNKKARAFYEVSTGLIVRKL